MASATSKQDQARENAVTNLRKLAQLVDFRLVLHEEFHAFQIRGLGSCVQWRLQKKIGWHDDNATPHRCREQRRRSVDIRFFVRQQHAQQLVVSVASDIKQLVLDKRSDTELEKSLQPHSPRSAQ